MDPTKKYYPPDILPLLQKEQKEGIVVWEGGNGFFKVVTDLKKEFADWTDVSPDHGDGTNFIIVNIPKWGDVGPCEIWMIDTPETHAFFIK